MLRIERRMALDEGMIRRGKESDEALIRGNATTPRALRISQYVIGHATCGCMKAVSVGYAILHWAIGRICNFFVVWHWLCRGSDPG